MIQSEVHRTQSYHSTNRDDLSLPDERVFNQFESCLGHIDNSYEVAQSKILSDKSGKILENKEKSLSSYHLNCPSCEYWEAWAYQSQKKILLIEKNLIDRQKVLQQKMMCLQNQLRDQSFNLRKKQKQFQQRSIKDKETIRTLFQKTNELESLLIKLNPNWKHRKTIENQINKETQWKQNINNGIKTAFKNNRNIKQDLERCQKQKHQNINSLISQTSEFFESSENETNRRMENQFKCFNFKRNKNYQDHERSIDDQPNLDSTQKMQFLRKNSGTFHKKQVQSESSQQRQQKSKAIVCQPSGTSLGDPLCSRNTSKTIKLHNNRVNVQKSIFNQTTTQCSFVNDVKRKGSNSNQYGNYNYDPKIKNDELTTLISQQGNENYKNGNPQMCPDQQFNSRTNHKANKQTNYQLTQELRRLKFENQNLKSYNRVLLQKLSNSRPKKY